MNTDMTHCQAIFYVNIVSNIMLLVPSMQMVTLYYQESQEYTSLCYISRQKQFGKPQCLKDM